MNEENRTRLEEFRQSRKEIRGSAEYLLGGIDVAKDKHYAFCIYPHGATASSITRAVERVKAQRGE